MSDPRSPDPVKLVISLFSGDGQRLEAAVRILAERYGRADFISEPLPFDYTDYYAKEFGAQLIRRLVAFERLVRPEELPDIKIWTNGLEKRLAGGEQRRVNIDPGYLAMAHLILATGKGYAHRPALREGIYADLTLIYRGGAFHTLPWTYPDYAGPEMTGMLIRIREKYLLQLKRRPAGEEAACDPESALPMGKTND